MYLLQRGWVHHPPLHLILLLHLSSPLTQISFLLSDPLLLTPSSRPCLLAFCSSSFVLTDRLSLLADHSFVLLAFAGCQQVVGGWGCRVGGACLPG